MLLEISSTFYSFNTLGDKKTITKILAGGHLQQFSRAFRISRVHSLHDIRTQSVNDSSSKFI